MEERTIETTEAAETWKGRLRLRGCAILILAILVAGMLVSPLLQWRAMVMEETQKKACRVDLERVWQELTDYAKAHGSYSSAYPYMVMSRPRSKPPPPECVYVAGYRADNAPSDAILAFTLRPIAGGFHVGDLYVDGLYMAIHVDSRISEPTFNEWG